MEFFSNSMQIHGMTVCLLNFKKLWLCKNNKYVWYISNSLKRKTSHLLLHHDSSDCSLDHIGPVQTVHTVDSEDALLLTDDSSLIHPVSRSFMLQQLLFFRIITVKTHTTYVYYCSQTNETDTHQAHFMSEMISEMASVRTWTFSNLIPRLRDRKRKNNKVKTFWHKADKLCTCIFKKKIQLPVFMEVKWNICQFWIVVKQDLLQIRVANYLLPSILIH